MVFFWGFVSLSTRFVYVPIYLDKFFIIDVWAEFFGLEKFKFSRLSRKIKVVNYDRQFMNHIRRKKCNIFAEQIRAR